MKNAISKIFLLNHTKIPLAGLIKKKMHFYALRNDLLIHNMMTYYIITFYLSVSTEINQAQMKVKWIVIFEIWDYDLQMYFKFSTEINQTYIYCTILKWHDDFQIYLTIRIERNQVYVCVKFVVIFEMKWWHTNVFSNWYKIFPRLNVFWDCSI